MLCKIGLKDVVNFKPWYFKAENQAAILTPYYKQRQNAVYISKRLCIVKEPFMYNQERIQMIIDPPV